MLANADEPAGPGSPDEKALEHGKRLRQEGRCAEAIPVLDKLLERQLTIRRWSQRELNEMDEDRRVAERIRERRLREQGQLPPDEDLRHDVLWEIGQCKFTSRDYQGALTAFRKSREYRIGASCGNADRQWDYRHRLQEAVTLEYLGRTPEAVGLYTQALRYMDGSAARDRLFDLYAATGQLDDLRHLAAGDGRAKRVDSVSYRFRVADLEKHRNWRGLVQQLRSHGRTDRWLVVQALARHGDDTVPLLLAEVDKDAAGWPDIPIWLWRAVGLAVTPRTATAIANRARREPITYAVSALIAGLRVAGPAGEQVLAALEKDPPSKLRSALDRKPTADAIPNRDPMTFPPIPAKLRLPASLSVEAP